MHSPVCGAESKKRMHEEAGEDRARRLQARGASSPCGLMPRPEEAMTVLRLAFRARCLLCLRGEREASTPRTFHCAGVRMEGPWVCGPGEISQWQAVDASHKVRPSRPDAQQQARVSRLRAQQQARSRRAAPAARPWCRRRPTPSAQQPREVPAKPWCRWMASAHRIGKEDAGCGAGGERQRPKKHSAGRSCQLPENKRGDTADAAGRRCQQLGVP